METPAVRDSQSKPADDVAPSLARDAKGDEFHAMSQKAEAQEAGRMVQTDVPETPDVPPRRSPWRKLIWVALAAFLLFQIYYVREMLAALVIFVALFAVVAVIAAVVYALGRAGETTISVAEPVAHRAIELAEEVSKKTLDVSKKTFRRPRSAPAP